MIGTLCIVYTRETDTQSPGKCKNYIIHSERKDDGYA